MAAALADVGDAECVLEAQVQVAGIYAEFGFQRISEEFVEDGIPHVTMRRPPGRRAIEQASSSRNHTESDHEDTVVARQAVLIGVRPRSDDFSLLGFAAGIAWQSYGGGVRKAIAGWSPRLAWLAPAPVPSGGSTERLKAVSLALASARQSLDKLSTEINRLEVQGGEAPRRRATR